MPTWQTLAWLPAPVTLQIFASGLRPSPNPGVLASSCPSGPEPWPSSLSLPPAASLLISGRRWMGATEWPQRSPREAGVCPDIRGIVNPAIICSPSGTQTSQFAGASRPMLSLECSPHFLSPCWAPTVPHLSLQFPLLGSLPGPHDALGSLCGAAKGQKNAPTSLPAPIIEGTQCWNEPVSDQGTSRILQYIQSL